MIRLIVYKIVCLLDLCKGCNIYVPVFCASLYTPSEVLHVQRLAEDGRPKGLIALPRGTDVGRLSMLVMVGQLTNESAMSAVFLPSSVTAEYQLSLQLLEREYVSSSSSCCCCCCRGNSCSYCRPVNDEPVVFALAHR